ncbi:hypothetical protein BJX63DRAFT_235333 [Aspergillus granulosus]|uniref:Uncharacterized protein n=1 Tax=Aspergillus granulosus TaxID=176169 RepID=A0ABR4HBH9_9EURO
MCQRQEISLKTLKRQVLGTLSSHFSAYCFFAHIIPEWLSKPGLWSKPKRSNHNPPQAAVNTLPQLQPSPNPAHSLLVNPNSKPAYIQSSILLLHMHTYTYGKRILNGAAHAQRKLSNPPTSKAKNRPISDLPTSNTTVPPSRGKSKVPRT